MDAPSFDGFASAFLPIHENDGEFYMTSLTLDGIDRFQGGSARSDDVIDDDHILPERKVSFDLLAGSVAFGFFSYSKNLKCLIGMLAGGGHADGQRYRIRPESHAADSLDGEFFRMDFGTNRMPTEISDHCRSERIEGCDAAIDIEIRLFSRGQGEGPGANGFLEKESFEVGGCLKHAGRVSFSQKRFNRESENRGEIEKKNLPFFLISSLPRDLVSLGLWPRHI